MRSVSGGRPAPGSTVLVTGGLGFVGAAVVRRLVEDGFHVRVLDDMSTGKKGRLAGLPTSAVNVLVGDVRDADRVREACAGATAAVHLAGPPPAADERAGLELGVGATLGLCAAALRAGLRRLVMASSAAVYGGPLPSLVHEEVTPRPTSLEGAHKLAAETYLRVFAARDGLPAVILRIFAAYGPGQGGNEEGAPLHARLIADARARRPFALPGDGSQLCDLIHVDDVARAVSAALITPGVSGRTFNIASGAPLSLRELAALLSELAGGLPAPRYLPARPGDVNVRPSIGAAVSGLGFRARVRLRDGLAACLSAAPPAARPPSLFADRQPSWALADESSRQVTP